MLRRLPVLLVAIAAVVALASPAAAKGKLNCRLLTFAGAAGMCVPPDHVQIRVVDALGDEIHKSCDDVHVQSFETALSFGARMPRDLGSAGDGDCGTHYLEPNPPPKKCLNGPVGSCKYKWKASKQTLQVCCWAAHDCKGLKIGNFCAGGGNAGGKCAASSACPGGTCAMRVGTLGISAQKQIQGPMGDLTFLPTPVPVVSTDPVFVQLDPIAMAQLPPPALGSCRVGTANAIGALASTILKTLVSCHAQQLKGFPIVADCNTVNGDSDPAGRVDVAVAKLTAAAQVCATGGTPLALGYHGCPAPCDSMAVNTCAAGLVGAPCTSDASCDSGVGAGDGKCGQASDWSAVGACMACVADNAITTAVTDKYGTVGPGLAVENIKCQDEIGKSLAFLISAQLKITSNCQKLLDGGKSVLAFCQKNFCVAPAAKVGVSCASDDDCAPPDARLCKYADQSGLRAFAEAKTRIQIVDKACALADPANLDSCDTTIDGLGDCVIQNALDASEAISDAVFPEGIGH